jgi:transposase InsO family protein
VLVLVTHDRRELLHLGVKAHPAAAWVWRQLVEATRWGRRPRQLIRDRDCVSAGDFRDRAKALGIETVLTPVRAPRATAVAERAIGTLRRDCLDRLIPFVERHVRAILGKYVDYYNTARPHRALQVGTPRPQARPRAGPAHSVRSRPSLGGLHHGYESVA